MKKKIIDENGRLFGKLSIIDLLVIILLVAVIAVVVVKVVDSRKSVIGEEKVKVEYVVKISGIRQYSVDALEKSNNLYSSPNVDDKYPIGTIKYFHKTDATELVRLDNGEYVYTTIDDRFDLEITVEADATKAYSGYFLAKDIQLLCGKDIEIYNDYVKCEGTIISFNVK